MKKKSGKRKPARKPAIKDLSARKAQQVKGGVAGEAKFSAIKGRAF
jgi:hypothetical protein